MFEYSPEKTLRLINIVNSFSSSLPDSIFFRIFVREKELPGLPNAQSVLLLDFLKNSKGVATFTLVLNKEGIDSLLKSNTPKTLLASYVLDAIYYDRIYLVYEKPFDDDHPDSLEAGHDNSEIEDTSEINENRWLRQISGPSLGDLIEFGLALKNALITNYQPPYEKLNTLVCLAILKIILAFAGCALDISFDDESFFIKFGNHKETLNISYDQLSGGNLTEDFFELKKLLTKGLYELWNQNNTLGFNLELHIALQTLIHIKNI